MTRFGRELCVGLAAVLMAGTPAAFGQDSGVVRIGVARFSHETCTFCPRETGVAEWEFYGAPLRGDDVLTESPYVQGFVAAAREYQNVEIVGAYAPRNALGGSSGSWITREAFDKYSAGIARSLAAIDGLDGVYLSLHGAMAVTGVPRPEAELVRRVRAAVGSVPIVATFDLHGNEDEAFAEAADAAFVVKRYPHYDARLQGARAARLMVRTLRGSYRPVMVAKKPGIITPSVFQGTGVSPAREIMERARRWEARVPDVFVSVFFGFAYADVPDVGAAVFVVTNDDRALADEIAQDMTDYMWRLREQFAGRKLPKTEAGVRQAIEAAAAGETPVIIADHADRTGNSTHVLAELVRQGASRFVVATISDRKAVAALREAHAVGDRVVIDVGGYEDQYAGEPLRLDGVLDFLGPYRQFESVAVVRFGAHNRVVLTPALHQVKGPEIFEALGIDLDAVEIVSLKSRVHFRRGFVETGIAGAVFEVDAPGLGPADLTGLEYENIPKDIYPLGSVR